MLIAVRAKLLGVMALLGPALLGCGSAPVAPVHEGGGIPPDVLAGARPIGYGTAFRPPARGPVIGPCRRGLGARYGVHVEVFAADRVVLIPAGIGTRPPRALNAGRIVAAGCYGALVSVEPTGVLLVRPGARRYLAELFASWGQRLSRQRLADFRAAPGGEVAAFVDGRRWLGEPGRILLRPHAEVVLEVGPFVPPHRRYTFPPGS